MRLALLAVFAGLALGQVVPPGSGGTSSSAGGTITLGGDVTGPSGANSIKSSVGLTGAPTTPTPATGDASTQIANDAFVANAISYFTPYGSVQAATIAILSNAPAYNNGTSGVGATLTATTFGALVVDGYTVLLNDRILVKNQAAPLQNGVYTQTTLGTGGVDYILTRATDYNSLNDINFTGDIQLIGGSTLNGQNWYLNSKITAVGTSALNYSENTSGTNSGNGNVKASGSLTNNQIVIGQGGKTIATSSTPVLANIVVASSPGAGIAHFAGSTQAVTSSAIVAADITSATITGTQIASSIALAGSPTTTTQSANDNSTKVATTAYVDRPVPFATPGSSHTLAGKADIFVCTTTCTITVPVPAAGLQYCVMNDDNVATVITMSAIGSSGQYENQARTAYGTATTGTLVSGGAVKDFVCLLGRDSTHYLFASGGGIWTAN